MFSDSDIQYYRETVCSAWFVTNIIWKMSFTHIETAGVQNPQEEDGVVDINLYTLELLKETCPDMDPINMARTALRLVNRAKLEVERREKFKKVKTRLSQPVRDPRRCSQNAGGNIEAEKRERLHDVETGRSEQVCEAQRYSHNAVVYDPYRRTNYSGPPANHVIPPRHQAKHLVQSGLPGVVISYSTYVEPQSRNGSDTYDERQPRNGNAKNGFKRKRRGLHSGNNMRAKRPNLYCYKRNAIL